MLIIIMILLLIIYLYLGWKYPAIALVTCPFVAGVMIFIGVEDENITVTLIAIAMFAATLSVVMISKPEPGDERWPQQLVKCVIISLGLILISAALLVLIGWGGGYGYLLFALFFASIGRYGLISRDTTALYVISTIGSSMRQNLPLPMALESAARDCKDKHSLILQRIKKWLIQGYSLSESIKRGYPKCPGYAVAMISAAERIEQLPDAIQAIKEDMMAKSEEHRKIRPVHPLYPVILMVFTFFMLLGVVTFVMPSFVTAVDELDVPVKMPFASRLLISIMKVVVYEFGWMIGIALALLVFVVIPISIYIRFRPRRPDRPYLLSRIGDFVKWHLPVLHHFEKNYSLVHVVELLRLSLNAGCPVNEAIENTLGLDVNNCFKKRLRRCLEKVERGDNIAGAIRESGLGSPLAWAFDEKVNQGNTLSILETLESFYRSNYSYTVNLARFIIWPCIILLMGVIVGFVVYGIFSPTVVIIKTLAESVIP
jgi:type II secretory pathway component PulF